MNNDGLTLNQLAERNAALVTELEKLRTERDRLAAENVGLKSAITDHSQSVHFCEVCGKDDPCSTDDVCYALKDIPATDRIVAGIKADGVEEFAKHCDESIGFVEPEDEELYTLMEEQARDFAKQLREGAK